MLEGDEVARLLDILGNRNRRRIIQLLRQKPCFVTEISERLMISPKAVIEHLHMMENGKILSSRSDVRRRKYYYISQDFNVEVNLYSVAEKKVSVPVAENTANSQFFGYIYLLNELFESRKRIITDLEYIERDIDSNILELRQCSKGILEGESEINLVIALTGYEMTFRDISEVTGLPANELDSLLNVLVTKGIVERTDKYYRVCDKYGK
ncbi:MAG: ArsR family transcriptional regulator [Methanogenium sp.]|nr:ArsR family transcriptional regulator [Methanogenium sp.]